ncbi:hypothetical protein GKZ89_07285 [Bacillus mangrovi]|uniref:Spore coat protein CotO n=1 Tax=Metabacillus mangrovi TaxID=1491830 RepID=A0A7X2S4Q9_9BACI|nr:CotO family spore coat protein [Metabacillus mangrovi]MTH53213.1 hypothetical protein [Metabacillus mangrovi]
MSEKNEKQAKQPLMYIVQPDSVKPQANMQAVAIKKSVSAKPKKEQKIEQIDNVQEADKAGSADLAAPAETGKIDLTKKPAEPASERAASQETPVYERKTRKSFNSMSITEKISFFASLPSNIPRTLCQVELADQTYRGIITGEKDGFVLLRTSASSQPVSIKAEDIKAIQPLGF